MRRLLLASALAVAASVPAKAEFVGVPNNNMTPFELVAADYNRKGFDEATFVSRYGNEWHVWRSHVSGNTLIWSLKNNHGRGEGFNCFADGRPNYWGHCTRYDIASGQINGVVSLRITDDGTVIDSYAPQY